MNRVCHFVSFLIVLTWLVACTPPLPYTAAGAVAGSATAHPAIITTAQADQYRRDAEARQPMKNGLGVKAKGQIAIGERLTTEGEQEHQWQHGAASFRLYDKRGLLGAAGHCYCAWQLPNVYTGPHTPLPNRRQRRLNRQLADLRNRGCAGIGQAVKEDVRRSRRYYPSGAAAWRMWGYGLCCRVPRTNPSEKS